MYKAGNLALALGILEGLAMLAFITDVFSGSSLGKPGRSALSWN